MFQFRNRSYPNRQIEQQRRAGHVEVVKLLMARGADPSLGDCNGSALWFARDYLKDEEFTRLLLNETEVKETPH